MNVPNFSSHPQLAVAPVHHPVMAFSIISTVVLIGVFSQIAQIVRLHVIAVHHMFARSRAAFSPCIGGRRSHVPGEAAPVTFVAAASALHAQASLQTCQAVCGDAVDFAVAASRFVVGAALSYAELFAVRVLARQIEKVDTGEDREEAAEERDGVACVDGVETLEEQERGDEGECREGHVVQGIDAAEKLVLRCVCGFVESVSLTYLSKTD